MRFGKKQGPAIRSQLFSLNLTILLFAQAVGVTGWFAVVTAGGILGRSLAANPALATLPVSLLIVGNAVSTFIASWTMAHVGRARGFAIGATVGAFGAACAFLATLTHDFALLCGGSIMMGCAAAFSQQYRFAATECVGAAAAPKAISIVLLGSIFGAFLGPGLMSWGEDWVAGVPFGGSFAAIVACYLLGAAALLALRPMTPSAEEETTGGARPLRVIVRGHFFIAAVTGGAIGWGVMTVLMTAVPLAMPYCRRVFPGGNGGGHPGPCAGHVPSFIDQWCSHRTLRRRAGDDWGSGAAWRHPGCGPGGPPHAALRPGHGGARRRLEFPLCWRNDATGPSPSSSRTLPCSGAERFQHYGYLGLCLLEFGGSHGAAWLERGALRLDSRHPRCSYGHSLGTSGPSASS